MRKIKKNIAKLLMFCLIISGAFGGGANVSAVSDPNQAPPTWAFDATSVDLHDKIVELYPSIDTNNDGFISVEEAQAYTGEIKVGWGNSGTLNGIENFINITALEINGGNITGKLPNNIGNLKELKTLVIQDNMVIGEIPSSIGNLDKLKTLCLNGNKLTGKIPSSLGSLKELGYLTLSGKNNRTGETGNQLSGEIPNELGNLEKLFYLNLESNQLSGEIPNSIGNLPKLQYLYVGDNHLEGEVPSNLLDLAPILKNITLNNNHFTAIDISLLSYLVDSTAWGWVDVRHQTYTTNLTNIGIVNKDFEFIGLPAYEQFSQVGAVFEYTLLLPDGNTISIVPTIVNGVVTISGNELSQKGNYKLTALGTSASFLFTDFVYETNFAIGDDNINYVDAIADGVKGKETSTKIVIDLSKAPEVGDLTINDITLNSTNTINKDDLTSLGNGKYELAISGTWNEGISVDVVLAKDGVVFTPNVHSTTLHTKAKDNGVKPSKPNGGKLNSLPQTGDSTALYSMLILMNGSLLTFGYLIYRKREIHK